MRYQGQFYPHARMRARSDVPRDCHTELDIRPPVRSLRHGIAAFRREKGARRPAPAMPKATRRYMLTLMLVNDSGDSTPCRLADRLCPDHDRAIRDGRGCHDVPESPVRSDAVQCRRSPVASSSALSALSALSAFENDEAHGVTPRSIG